MEQIRKWMTRWLHRILLYSGPEIALVALGLPVGALSNLGSWEITKITLGLIGQNMSFTWVSRARQSNNLWLHGMFAIGSNGFFIFVITTIVAHYTNLPLKVWYTVCTTVGSLHAHFIALHKIETMKRFRKDTPITRLEHEQSLERLRSELTNQHKEDLEALRAELVA